MRDAILEKLTMSMSEAPSSEAVVAYTFIEARKILEREHREDDFKALKFFCDWVVHVKLTRYGAKDALAKLDTRLQNLDLASLHDVGPDEEFFRFVSFEWLLEELERFCGEMRLPKNWVVNPTYWRECLRFYGEVVRDCALAVNRPDQTGTYIHKVVLTTVEPTADGPDVKSLGLDWEFTLSDGITFKQSVEFRYPSISSEELKRRPSTTEFGF